MAYDYTEALDDILEFGRHKISQILPSEFAEKYRTMDSSVSRYKGRFSYDVSPYTKEIVDCLSPDHPARTIVVKKGAQIGFSTGVIEPGVVWIISQDPGNILFLTGHSDLSEEAVAKIDDAIDSCGIRHLIKSNTKRARANKTGDTNSKKEFPGGSLVSGSAGNHKLLRQRSCKFGFVDDYDAAKKAAKQSGSTTSMIDQRFASYADVRKLYYISSPELLQTSNIQPLYLKGDQRKYNIHCPHCKKPIPLYFTIEVDGDKKQTAGITYKLDNHGMLIDESVGYICQLCAGFFNDSNKYEMNLNGLWIPTATASEEGFFSYQISSLYAPPGMYDWKHYVRKYIEACPPAGKVKPELYKTFVNLCLGEPYEETGEEIKANDLQKNIRKYEIGTVPNLLSQKDGNGQIVLLTCAVDMGGVTDDVRLDYEILAWSESGSSYSIDHGSIGTFIFGESQLTVKEDRKHWTYDHYKPNCVWPELEKLLGKTYELDDKTRRMKVAITGLDTGHFTVQAYSFIDRMIGKIHIVGLKGKDRDKYLRYSADIPNFKKAQEKANLFLIQVGRLKDELAELTKFRFDEKNDEKQPPGFMNYPSPSDGKYNYPSYFSHYEAEIRVVENKEGEGIAAIWKKKTTAHQNHFFDCRVYNMVCKEIMTMKFCEMKKLKNYGWSDFVDIIIPKK